MNQTKPQTTSYVPNLIRCKSSDHGNEAKIESASLVLKTWNNGLRSSFISQNVLGLPGELKSSAISIPSHRNTVARELAGKIQERAKSESGQDTLTTSWSELGAALLIIKINKKTNKKA